MVKTKPEAASKKSFGKIIKMYRINQGISQTDFAKQLGTTQQVLSYYENESRVPKISFAVKFKKVTGIDIMEGIDQIFVTNMSGNDKIKNTITDMAIENSALKKENKDLKNQVKELEKKLQVFSEWANTIKKAPKI